MATLEPRNDPREDPGMHADEKESSTSSHDATKPYISPSLSIIEPQKPIDVVVPNYRTVEVNNKPSHTLFVILVKWKATHGQPIAWTVSHRFSEFDTLHQTLSKHVSNLPPLPKKSWWRTFAPDFVNQRRRDLEVYLRGLNEINAVVLMKEYQTFLDINLHVKLPYTHLPSQKVELVDDMFGYSDIIYDRDREVILTACSEAHIANRIDAHVSNFRFPWEEKGVVTPVGSSSVWIIQNDNWTAVNTEYYEVGATSIAWDALRNYFFVGLDNGHIMVYLLDIEGEKITLVQDLILHTDRVSGLVYDKKLDILITCSRDRLLTITDVKTRGLLDTSEQGPDGYSSMVLDSENSIMFVGTYASKLGALVGTSGGKIHIYNVKDKQLEFISTLSGHTDSVRCIHYDPLQFYLFSGGFDASCGIWQIHTGQQLRRSRSVGWLTGGPKSQIKSILFARSLNYVIAGHKNGKITLWNVLGGALLYAFHAHNGGVTRLIWLDDKLTLLSVGTDGYLKFWNIPKLNK